MGISQRRCSGLVRLQRAVNGDVALPRQIILEERELTGHLPLNAGNGDASSTVKTGVIEVASLEIHESSGNPLVRIVAPRGRIRRGSCEEPHRRDPGDFSSEIATVNRAQARRPRQEKAPNSDRKGRIGALVRKP